MNPSMNKKQAIMRQTILIASIIVAFIGSYLARQWVSNSATSDVPSSNNGAPQRIVSMAPSITEVVYALGLEDRLVGVTRYCQYPREAQEKQDIGGYIDPNYEAMKALQTDLVLLLPVHEDSKHRLNELNIPTMEMEHRTVDGIMASIQLVGNKCDANETALTVSKDILKRAIIVKSKTEGLPKPRVLLSAARVLGTGAVDEVYAAGKNQWYDDIITAAGGQNVFEDETVQFPALYAEGIYRLDPDVIIELTHDVKADGLTVKQVVEEWNSLDKLRAVKEGKVFVINGSHTQIPGPRFIEVLEDVAKVLHPDVDWTTP
jgi:iron complex transport system substrate-binding protein